MEPGLSTATTMTRKARRPLESPRQFATRLKREHPEESALEIAGRMRVDMLDNAAFENGQIQTLWIGVLDYWIERELKDDEPARITAPPLRRTPEERAATKAILVEKIAAADAERIETIVEARFMDMICPNGRRLADCTGAMCRRFGGFFTEIANRLRPRDTVRQHLSESELAGIARHYRTADPL